MRWQRQSHQERLQSCNRGLYSCNRVDGRVFGIMSQGDSANVYSCNNDRNVTGPLSFPLPRISALPPALPGSGNAVYELVDPNPSEWGLVGKTLNRGLRTRLLER